MTKIENMLGLSCAMLRLDFVLNFDKTKIGHQEIVLKNSIERNLIFWSIWSFEPKANSGSTGIENETKLGHDQQQNQLKSAKQTNLMAVTLKQFNLVFVLQLFSFCNP